MIIWLFSVPAPFSCTAKRSCLFLNKPSGQLASCNYPLPCGEPIICCWQFKIFSEYNVVLSFDLFNLSHSKNCDDDYVEIHRAKYCGSKKPATITSEGSDMRVTFRSSGKSTYPGFKASYTSKSEHPLYRCSSLLIMQFFIKSHKKNWQRKLLTSTMTNCTFILYQD